MQASGVNRLSDPQFDVSLIKAWQLFKQQAQQKGTRPKVRFSAERLPGYCAREVSQVVESNDNGFVIKTALPGFSGRQGALPRMMTRAALHASFDFAEDAPVDFIDSFNNRYFRLFCQAESKHEITANLEEETFSWNQHLTSLTDVLLSFVGVTGEKHASLCQHLIQYTGLLGLKLTCPDTLKNMLEDYFDARFEIDSGGLEFTPLADCGLTSIGRSGQNRQLGTGALIGKSVPMAGQILRIKICPRDYKHYLEISRSAAMTDAIDFMVRNFIGVNLRYALYMRVDSDYLPLAQLSTRTDKSLCIGRSAWMNQHSEARQYVDMPLRANQEKR
ncbi:type VI secretion system baseplate subunit TssG [Veronia pacifica]|uniref:Type VI secretion protein VasB-1 n=1 Tax=Veronia pacifica TaxID=1080227 RepID=A0A1C3EDN6_9GAMM|nr:type VI secretion system baseplate subunit TssG [Veronia pacifica]ODA31367.1 type VI secretion protein VasB-1 [Veronia pacifica]